MSKDIIFEGISGEWRRILDNELLDKILESLESVDITPGYDKMFEFARLTPIDNIKVIILGQDPYPTKNTAHGLAFSSKTNVPPSLKNIYKNLYEFKLTNEINEIGDLSFWAIQGVLLINTALTTITGEIGSHIKLWKKYTNLLLKNLSMKIETYDYMPICMLLGDKAQKKSKYISNCTILEYAHPSPLAQHSSPFIECGHFAMANNLLTEQNQRPINWNISLVSNKVLDGFRCHIKDTIVFTDGSCQPNKKCPESIGGYAACFVAGPYADTTLYGNIDNTVEFASNIRAEGYAIYRVLKFMKKQNNWNKLIIVTDCMFWIEMISITMPSWDFKNIDFSEKQNSDLTKPLYKLYNKLIDNDKKIELVHIRSHNKNGWLSKEYDSYEYFSAISNEYVDDLAKYARTIPIDTHIIGNIYN